MTEQSPLQVNSADIDAAARVLAPFAVRTPLLSSPALDQRAGTRVFLKPELL
ncbi:MAG: pyridoxal-5'-phosphate-dependent protein, partial [Bradyrhizobium sp.]